VRRKVEARKENDQDAMSVLIDFIRQLREETGSAVCFVHHRGHQGDHMRGSSDLESVWETRLTWKRDGDSPLVEVAASAGGSPDRPDGVRQLGHAGMRRLG
jgi:hypothetical protein